MKKHSFVLFPLMLCMATSSSAMSLGRHSGAALIGKPLSIAVQAVLDSRDDAASQCLSAEVFYGDNKVDSSRVRVSLERINAASPESVIRIRSSLLIDEPSVTVYLRAGCQQKNERKYVLLADMVSDPSSREVGNIAAFSPGGFVDQAGVSAAPGLPVAGAGLAVRNPTPDVKPRTGSTRPARSARPAVGVEQTAAPDPAFNKAPRVRNSATSERRSPRLKLEPFELGAEREPTLRASRELLSLPAANEQQRLVAAALWRALTAQPEEILKDTEKLRALEIVVASLQAESRANRLALTEANSALQTAQAARFANPLVYLLVLLLLLAFASLVYLWTRRSDRQVEDQEDLPWWRKNKSHAKGWADSSGGAGDRPSVHGSPLSAALLKGARKSTTADVDLDLGSDLNESGFQSAKPAYARSATMSAIPIRDRADFAMSMTHVSRAVKAEELFDVQQQADFFVSLGQHDQAIELLREHIDGNVQTSALVYLDLFNLYHSLKRETDYEALRGDFSARFNARMPEFALYTDASPGLEAYPAALARIVALWPSFKVLEVIEESIFRRLEVDTETFDLGAYRELLLLHSIAKEIAESGASDKTLGSSSGFKESRRPALRDKRSSKFSATSIQPLSASVSEVAENVGVPLIVPGTPKPSPRLGLDVDLSVPLEVSSVQKDAPEIILTSETDSQFFAQFAKEVTVPTSQDLNSSSLASPRSPPEIDNLIDFDAFDSSVPPVERPRFKG